MDTNKKYLYFNPTTDSVAAAVSVPVSGFAGMETTSSSNLIMYFRESTETDTLDITVTRDAGSDPKLVMEEIVNAINFAKDSTVVVADNFTGEYVSSKISTVASLSDGFSFPVKINRPVMAMVDSGTGGFATDAGAGFSASSYDTNHGTIGQIQGEVITTIFIDIAAGDGGLGLSSGTHANDAIGIADSSNPAYFTRITTLKNGIVYGGELICVEAPVGGEDSIGVFANSSGSIAPDADASEHAICAASNQTLGKRTAFSITTHGNQDDYLYLIQGDTTDAAYTAGKFIVRLFGAPTSQLNDIA